MANRQLSSWVDGFVKYTDHLSSPRLFRKWAAISAIAGALERRVWVKTMEEELYPNMYIVLVGPPGVGKTIVSSRTEELWRSLQDHWVAPKSVSKASLIDSLAEAKQSISRPGQVPAHVEFNSLLVHSGELGVLIPSYENDFMNVLTDIYDGRIYEEKRRTKDLHIKINKPLLNILAATTPSYLNNVLPEGAWEQGFLSRTMIIYSGVSQRRSLFATKDSHKDADWSVLKSDLRGIGRMFGQLQFTEESAAKIEEWHMGGGEPTPDHPRLVNYLTRRTVHLLKLCMVASVSRGEDYTINMLDLGTAMEWLYEAEDQIPEAFKAMETRGNSSVINEAWHFLYKKYAADKQPVAEQRLVQFLMVQVPAHEVLRIIDIMEKSGSIKKSLGKGGVFGWTPIQPDY